jgi:multicomponent Na+:H+ antiporter subunit G
MTLLDWIGGALMVGGALFFLAGTVGLLRFPDVHSRLHALTKADNVGLGLLLAGLALWTDSVVTVPKLLLIWVLALAASATSCYLIAHYARPRPPLGGE